MRIDIFSDTVCPWCFIGKRRLERALAERPQPGLTVRWRTFQLNPDMPAEGMDRRTYLERKFGGSQNAERVYGAVREAGQSEGIPFAFDRIARTPNSLKSHQLLAFAAEQGDQDPLVERLFNLYFIEGADIGDTEVLIAAAGDVGLDTAAARAFLDEGRALDLVGEEDRQARQAGIQGVPTFVFNGHYAMSGAQEPKALFQLFDLAREEATPAAE
ncbi:DsbA family oxidoreductase [Ferruginivarius sediminum]|uniref:DsbA family oxidoreductase n=1 Tax=Ferruginivarius sediminum TaxID=2661937 RepID=A0A369TCX9_9PROT|nr:DsbA family oxidoreductase [Ferruginivarius sediminum]RDD62017.1 DsbA family oxidoreductase [Ferruginivarius sediminum]